MQVFCHLKNGPLTPNKFWEQAPVSSPFTNQGFLSRPDTVSTNELRHRIEE